MNNERRSRLKKIISDLSEVREEENDALFAMGAGLQASPAGFSVQENIDHMDGAISELEEIEM